MRETSSHDQMDRFDVILELSIDIHIEVLKLLKCLSFRFKEEDPFKPCVVVDEYEGIKIALY